MAPLLRSAGRAANVLIVEVIVELRACAGCPDRQFHRACREPKL